MKQEKEQNLVSNRKAFHDYEILDNFEAGIILKGTEIKSLRNHEGSLQDAYVVTKSDGLWIIHSSIPPYRYGNVYNHEEKRDRQLLMHKREIEKLKRLVQEKGVTLIPLSFYLKNGFVKVRLAVAKGKKQYDKRAALKDRELKQKLQRAQKNDLD